MAGGTGTLKRQITIADIFIVVLLGVLLPFSPLIRPRQSMAIGDKVVVYIHQRPSDDSLCHALQLTNDEIEEMRYYLRNHDVADEGYNNIASYHTKLLQHHRFLETRLLKDSMYYLTYDTIPARQRSLVAVKTNGGYWHAGSFHIRQKLAGRGITRDDEGRIVRALWDDDTVVVAKRTDTVGIYFGQMDYRLLASGQGVYESFDGSHYEGLWKDDKQNGFGFESSPYHQLRAGEWKNGRFLGERIRYTTERIYGIDISRHQHEKGRQHFNINWKNLRILSLGKKHDAGGQTFPVSFVYIKSTEGTSIRNRYYLKDYTTARAQGFHVGAYHFFSIKSSALEQATYFVNNTLFRPGDFPPVLDVEPTESQIEAIGDDELMRRISIFMEYVERRTHMRPILYVNQNFIFRHMTKATDIKKKYNVWIARYGEYKPDVKLVYWQLSSTGKVQGITGDVDINVFNGYQGQFAEFVRTGYHR